jgi:hypothetical protein
MSTLFRLLLTTIALLALSAPVHAARPLPINEINVNEHLPETQKSVSADSKHVDLVWWMTKEFWLAASKDSSSKASVKDFEKIFDENIIVAVVDVDIVNMADLKATDTKKIRESLKIIDVDGTEYRPIEQKKISTEVQVLIGVMGPMITKMMGNLGSSFEFYVFPASAKGKRIGNPYSEGKFTIQMLGNNYDYPLPLNSLLQKKIDKSSGEKFPGSYRFNPYSGNALSEQ